MGPLVWIVTATFAMSLIAWIGLLAAAMREEALMGALRPMVAFAAGSLIGGAFLHLLPETVARTGADLGMFVWLVGGFVAFFLLEQFLHWSHDHEVHGIDAEPAAPPRSPTSWLILIADGIHNFLGGLAIGGAFLAGPGVGAVTWLAAAAHEIPQELGDFAILLHGGWRKMSALTANFISALTIVPGGLAAWALGSGFDVTFLLPFAAGNFVYIAASDLIPEIKHSEGPAEGLLHFGAFVAGVGLLLAVRLAF